MASRQKYYGLGALFDGKSEKPAADGQTFAPKKNKKRQCVKGQAGTVAHATAGESDSDGPDLPARKIKVADRDATMSILPPLPPGTPQVPLMYIADDLRHVVIHGYDHPAYWPQVLPAAWCELLGWKPPHVPLMRLTVDMYASVVRQCAAAWVTMDTATRLQVSDRLQEIEDFAHAQGWTMPTPDT